jgi:hypothetical protein
MAGVVAKDSVGLGKKRKSESRSIGTKNKSRVHPIPSLGMLKSEKKEIWLKKGKIQSKKYEPVTNIEKRIESIKIIISPNYLSFLI